MLRSVGACADVVGGDSSDTAAPTSLCFAPTSASPVVDVAGGAGTASLGDASPLLLLASHGTVQAVDTDTAGVVQQTPAPDGAPTSRVHLLSSSSAVLVTRGNQVSVHPITSSVRRREKPRCVCTITAHGHSCFLVTPQHLLPLTAMSSSDPETYHVRYV